MAKTRNLDFGSAFHCLLLEPKKFDKTLYTAKEMIKVMDMCTAVKEVLPKEIFAGKKEWEYYYNYLGYRCKLKADIVIPQTVGDFKTTACNDHTDFLKQAIEYDYPRQAAWYLDCPLIQSKGINTFTIWAVSKTKPYPVFAYELDRSNPIIEAGRDEYKYLLEEFGKLPESEKFKLYGEN